MRLIPMSESELAWDRFYDNDFALGQYRQWADPDAQAGIRQNWCRVEITWERGRPGRVLARLTRKLPAGGLDTRGCTHLRFLGAICPQAVLRLKINGRVHELRGKSDNVQYTIPINARRICSLEFELVARQAGRGAVALVWTALVDVRRDKERLIQRGCYDERWEGLLAPGLDAIRPEVTLGLLFNQSDLARIRSKARSALYAPWAKIIRRHARKYLASRPEALIGRFACQPLHYTRPPERQGLIGIGGYPADWDHFEWVAFAGLLDGDRRLLRQAARWMLSVASCEYWCNDFAGALPGSRWHHRCFTEAHLTEQMALALDWAGGALTPEGYALVRDAISQRGLPRIQHDFLESEYIRSMNQGIVFNSGRIMGLLALSKIWPRAAVRLPELRADIREMFAKTFDRDGGSVEGPAYWHYTLEAGLPGVIALARHDRCAPARLLPAKIRRVPNYPFIFVSTSNPAASLPIADSRGTPVCTGDLAAMLAHVFPGRAAHRLAAWALRRPEMGGNPAIALIFGPSRLAPPAPLVPEFEVRRRSGQAVVCRKLAGVGQVRLQFYGAPGCGGSHSHQDRGNLLLEAGGEWVLVDRGVGSYHNPEQNVKRPEAHNLLVPDMPDGSVPFQDLSHKRDIYPRAVYRRGVFHAVMDTTAAWPGHVRLCRRTVHSPQPGVFDICDELEFAGAFGAALHLHTPLTLKERTAAGWRLESARLQVLVSPQWPVAEGRFAVEDFGIGSAGKAYGHLVLRAAPAHRLRLVTRITIAPQSDGKIS
jgi:hypothetical protein